MANSNQAADSDRTPIWGARDIAKFLNRPERAVYHALERNQLPGAKKVCGRWMLIPENFYRAVAA